MFSRDFAIVSERSVNYVSQSWISVTPDFDGFIDGNICNEMGYGYNIHAFKRAGREAMLFCSTYEEIVFDSITQ